MTEGLPHYTDHTYYLGYDAPASSVGTPMPPAPEVRPGSSATIPHESSNTSLVSGVWSEDGVVSGIGYVPLEQSDYAPVQELTFQPEPPTPQPVATGLIEESELVEPEPPELLEKSTIKQEEEVAPVPKAAAEQPASEPETTAEQPDLSSVAAMMATAATVKMMASGSTGGLNSKVEKNENRNGEQAVESGAPHRSGEKSVPSQESQEPQNEKTRLEDLVIPPRRKFSVPDEYGFYLGDRQNSARYAASGSGVPRDVYASTDLINALLGRVFHNNNIGKRHEQFRDPLEGYPDHQFARDIIYHEAGLIDRQTAAMLENDPGSSLARKELARRNELLRLVDKAVIDRDGVDLSRVAIVYDRVQRLKAEKEARGEDFTARRLTRMYARAQQRADRELASNDLDPERKPGLEAMKERARIALMLKRTDGTYPFL